MASNTNDNSTAKPTMTDSGHRTTKLPPTPNAEIISSSPVAALPKSEGASTESEPKAAAAASSEVVCVGRNNRAMTWGYSLNKGRRREMEDAITIVPSFMKLPCTAVGGCRAPDCKYAAEESSVHYFGLFDGHGGAQSSCSSSDDKTEIERGGNWERPMPREMDDGAVRPSRAASIPPSDHVSS